MSVTGDTAPARVEPLDALLDAVSGERMATTVAALASDGFTGRRVGSAGGAAARAWLGQRLADLGAAVGFASFPVRSVPEVYTPPTVRWHDGRATRRLRFGRDVAVHVGSADEPLVRHGGLAIAGAGDPAGRWLVVPAGTALSDAQGHARGAAGLLAGHGVDAGGWQFTMLGGPGTGPLPVLALSPAVHAAAERAAATRGAWLSGNAPVRRLDVTGTNVHGRLGPPAGDAAEILLTAHYDGVGDHPGLRQPAAADNASGVAVVLEAARVLATGLPDGTGLSVALLDAEEAGALGSAHHAAQLRDGGVAPLVLNVDGAASLHEAAAVEAGGPAHALLAALDQAGRLTGLPLAAGVVASDNRRYAATGLPAVGIGAGMAAYHSAADTPDRVEEATMISVARLVVATVWLAGRGGRR